MVFWDGWSIRLPLLLEYVDIEKVHILYPTLVREGEERDKKKKKLSRNGQAIRSLSLQRFIHPRGPRLP